MVKSIMLSFGMPAAMLAGNFSDYFLDIACYATNLAFFYRAWKLKQRLKA